MADAAAFFASKKKTKKKAFKFNANLVDASSVTATVHVDAPALSTEDPVIGGGDTPESAVTALASTTSPIATATASADWDDQAAVAPVVRNPAIPSDTAASAVLDMKTMQGDPRGHHPDNIAEKLRLEETKAQLAAARQGMEREALKLKEEQAAKLAKEEANKSRFSAAAGVGGKWVPSRLRSSGMGSSGIGGRMPGSMGGKLDVQDQELFPDLAAADKILEQKEKEAQPVFKAPKKTPVGGGASWASKMTKKQPEAAAPKPAEEKQDVATSPKVEPAVPVDPKTEPKAETAPAPAPKPIAKKVTKKKKKDVSTFAPSKSGGS